MLRRVRRWLRVLRLLRLLWMQRWLRVRMYGGWYACGGVCAGAADAVGDGV